MIKRPDEWPSSSKIEAVETTMTESKGVSPTTAEVEQHIKKLAAKYPQWVRLENVIPSESGQPIYAVTVTDREASDADKQNVLIVGGQHGNEESGRLVCLALLDWLVRPAAKAIRAKQKIVVMPNVNPDGADADTHLTPGGTRPNMDHPLSGATTPEGQAVEKVAWKLLPDVFVDCHACGGTGLGPDLVLHFAPRVNTEDPELVPQICHDMAAAGEKSGIPHTVFSLTWPGWMDNGGDVTQPSTMCFHYRNFHAISILTENSESNEVSYPLAQRARSGLERFKALLAWGQRRHPACYFEGYPNQLGVGMFKAGVVGVGKTAAQRRRSRIDIWKNADHWKRLGVEVPVQSDRNRLVVDYRGEPLTRGAGIQFRLTGKLKVKSLRFDGRALKPAQVGGYYLWHDSCSTYIVAALRKLQPGKHEIIVETAKA
jgi:hypothetical protein